MSRINTNVSSQIAKRNLTENNKMLNMTLERLSTGLRINRGKDDPAGLIASENLRAEKSALSSAIANAERADQLANIAEGGLQEVSNLLTDLRGLVTASANGAGLSTEELNANQLQINSILQTIDRISEATNFQGVKLLNGNMDFSTSSVSSSVADFRINSAKFQGTSYAIRGTVLQSARRASVFIDMNSAVVTSVSAGKLFTIEVAGSKGSREFSFSNGTNRSAIVAAINSFKDVLGVSAANYSAAASNTGVNIRSTEFGKDEFVSVKVVSTGGQTNAGKGIRTATAASEANATGALQTLSAAAINPVRGAGQDISATINGLTATGRGRTLKVNGESLDIEVTMNIQGAQTVNNTSINLFNVTGGGATFQLASNVDVGGKVSLGIQSVTSRKLGNSVVGNLSDLSAGKSKNIVTGDRVAAAKVVEEAIRQVSALRGRLGAFQKNVVGATIRNLGVSLENSSAAESVIRDADFATETASLTRSQILSQAAGNSLGLANSQPQSALALLQR
jgi:flagellin